MVERGNECMKTQTTCERNKALATGGGGINKALPPKYSSLTFDDNLTIKELKRYKLQTRVNYQ